MRLCTFLDMISIGRAAGRSRGWRPDFESDHQTPSLTTDKDTKEKTWAPQCNGEVKIVSHVHTYKNRLGHKQRETVTESLYLKSTRSPRHVQEHPPVPHVPPDHTLAPQVHAYACAMS